MNTVANFFLFSFYCPDSYQKMKQDCLIEEHLCTITAILLASFCTDVAFLL